MKESILTTVVPDCLTTSSCFSSESSHILAGDGAKFNQITNERIRNRCFYGFFSLFYCKSSLDEAAKNVGLEFANVRRLSSPKIKVRGSKC